MKHWKFRYYLKEGISNFFSHRFMTVAAITVITACTAHYIGLQHAGL